MIRAWFVKLLDWWYVLTGKDRATIILEITGIVVVGVYTTVAALQWCKMIEATNAQVATIRAWLVPTDNTPPPIAGIGPTTKFPIKIENTGQTLANLRCKNHLAEMQVARQGR
jgi:hypothetical protein